MSDRLLMLAPLSIEARALRAGAPSADVRRLGMGPRRAARAADVAAGAPPGPTLIAGFCGGLHPALAPGDVVLATELRGPHGITSCGDPAILAGVLRRGGLTVHVGPILSTPKVTMGRRRRELQRTGALAVDMESAWVAESLPGRPLVALRVVVDTGADELYRPLRTLRAVAGAYRSLRQAAALAQDWARATAQTEVVRAAPRAPDAGMLPETTEDLHFRLPTELRARGLAQPARKEVT